MDGYVLRYIKERTYLGLDYYGQDWMDYLPEWNTLNPQEAIFIDAFIDLHYNGDLARFSNFHQWLNRTTAKDYFMLYYHTSLEQELTLPQQAFSFIGYDIVCIKEPQHLEEFFYSSLFNEIDRVDHLLEQEDNTLSFVPALNQYALFEDISVAREFLAIRNRYYREHSNHTFETAFGTHYEIVKLYLLAIKTIS